VVGIAFGARLRLAVECGAAVAEWPVLGTAVTVCAVFDRSSRPDTLNVVDGGLLIVTRAGLHRHPPSQLRLQAPNVGR
jgi:hypothetical protein